VRNDFLNGEIIKNIGVLSHMENLKIVKAEWKSGIKNDTGKAWVGLEITLQGGEKFTVNKMLFLNETQCQLLGIVKPTKEGN